MLLLGWTILISHKSKSLMSSPFWGLKILMGSRSYATISWPFFSKSWHFKNRSSEFISMLDLFVTVVKKGGIHSSSSSFGLSCSSIFCLISFTVTNSPTHNWNSFGCASVKIGIYFIVKLKFFWLGKGNYKIVNGSNARETKPHWVHCTLDLSYP